MLRCQTFLRKCRMLTSTLYIWRDGEAVEARHIEAFAGECPRSWFSRTGTHPSAPSQCSAQMAAWRSVGQVSALVFANLTVVPPCQQPERER